MRSSLWLVVIMIIYGSLYPFNFVWSDISQIALLDWSLDFKQRTSNGDILSNILTFMPLGFLAFFSRYFNKQPLLLSVLYYLLIGLIFAYLLQIAQFFLPTRIPTAADAMINLAGMSIGVAIAFWLNRLIANKVTMSKKSSTRNWSAQYIMPLFLAITWLLYCFYPYFPMGQWSEMSLDWQSVTQPSHFYWQEWLVLSLLWCCFFDLKNRLPWQNITALRILIVGCFILGMKILIAHNELSLTWVIAMLMGFFLSLVIPNKNLNNQLLLITLALFVNSLFTWQHQLYTSQINWLPFSEYLHGSIWVNTQVFLSNLLIFSFLIYYASLRFQKAFIATCVVLSICVIIELLEHIRYPGHAGFSDPLMLLLVSFFYYQIKPSRLSVST